MLCKIARNCIGLVRRLEPTARKIEADNFKRLTDDTSLIKSRIKSDPRDHLSRTGNSSRQEGKMEATVVDIDKLSESVRGLKLLVADSVSTDTFKAGQWVDMAIPGIETVGGFSICSAPTDFKTERTLEFAVKYSDHPPAKWIHEHCQVGSTVTISFGGDFFYDPNRHDDKDILLIAGGVGINPIYSILRERSHRKTNRSNVEKTPSTKLLFSARNIEELIFKDRIEKIFFKMPQSSCCFFITKDEELSRTSTLNMHHKRIDKNIIAKNLHSFQTDPVCFICGPPNFINTMEQCLKDLGISSDCIMYEKWW